MKRFLLLALTAGLLSPIATNSEPIPEISDLDFVLDETKRIDFNCPKKVSKVMEDGRIKKTSKKLYKKCWADFSRDSINIMDRQTIKKKDILRHWHHYEWGDFRGWYFVYKTEDGSNKVFRLQRLGGGLKDPKGREENYFINTWLSQ